MDAGTLKQLVVKSMKEPKKGFYRTLDALRWLKQVSPGSTSSYHWLAHPYKQKVAPRHGPGTEKHT